MKHKIEDIKSLNPIKVNEKTIEFTDTAEHVRMLRSVNGNLPTILERFTAHRKALAGVLHTGVARSHRGNPAASLRILQTYGNPVLFSGLAPLVLSKQEILTIDQHHKDTLRSMQRVLQNTPQTVTCFLTGSLPGTAILHLRQMTIFGMITRLGGSLLHDHAMNIFIQQVLL